MLWTALIHAAYIFMRVHASKPSQTGSSGRARILAATTTHPKPPLLPSLSSSREFIADLVSMSILTAFVAFVLLLGGLVSGLIHLTDMRSFEAVE